MSTTPRRVVTRSKRSAQHYSCDSCRSRKLRCDRPIPCANCTTRGEECRFSQVPSTRRRTRGNVSLAHDDSQQLLSAATPTQLASTPLHVEEPANVRNSHESLMAEIQAIKRVVHDLEARVSSKYPEAARPDDGGARINTCITHSTPRNLSDSKTPTSPWTTETVGNEPALHLDGFGDAVSHLELVSMGQNLREPHLDHLDETIVFKIHPIRNIPQQSSHMMQMGKLMKCIHLPEHHEANILANKLLSELGYVYHVLHGPSLSGIIDETYRQISKGGNSVKPGHLLLLLSIIASSTHVWAAEDCHIGDDDTTPPLFSSASEANSQTPLWTKAAYDALHAQEGCAAPELETVLGIVVLIYLTYNVEGASLRYRSLMMMGFVMGQELGLHRVDAGNGDHDGADAIRVEVGRRAWWYLVATDWISSARYGGRAEGIYHVAPHQMMVRKPLNIDDVDLTKYGPNTNRLLSEPTDMSYFLQRLRVAKVARTIVDDISLAKTAALSSGVSSESHHSMIMRLDSELARVIRDIPPFLDLDTYGSVPESDQSERFIQAYLLNSLIQSQRCKLHLDYLRASSARDALARSSLSSSPSRDSCLYAARRIIRAERQLEGTKHVFTQTRLRLSVILHGIFTAAIVLLMDACVYGGGGLSQQEATVEDDDDAAVQDALRIIEEAKPHSLAAVRLHESLFQILARHHEKQVQLSSASSGAAGLAPSVAEGQSLANQGAPLTDGATMNKMAHNYDHSSREIQVDQPVIRLGEPLVNERQPPSPPGDQDDTNEYAQLPPSLDDFMNVDGFEWELFSILGPSSFF